MNKEKLRIDFETSMRAANRAERGIKNVIGDIPKLFEFLDERGLLLDDVFAQEALEYRGWLQEQTYLKKVKIEETDDYEMVEKAYEPNTLNAYLVAARSFYKYLVQTGVVPENHFKSLKNFSQEEYIPRDLLKEDEMQELLESMRDIDPADHLKANKSDLVSYIVVELLYSTGMRICEVANLCVDDLHLDESYIRIIEGKGGKDRIAYLTDYAVHLLSEYLYFIRPYLLTGHHEGKDTFFLSGLGWLQKMVNRTLKEHCEKLGFPPYTCHVIRHTVGYHLIRSGTDPRHVQQILGHSNLTTSMIYLRIDEETTSKFALNHNPLERRSNELEVSYA